MKPIRIIMGKNDPLAQKAALFSGLIAVFIAVSAFIHGLLLPDNQADLMISSARRYLSGISFSFWGIFFNNMLTALMMLLGGVIFSLPSLLFYYTNFLLLGVVVKYGFVKMGFLQVFLSLFPHGLFEIPAIMISFTIAVNFTFHLIMFLSKKKRGGTVELIKKSLSVYFLAVIPLLIAAAGIEVFITPELVRLFKTA